MSDTRPTSRHSNFARFPRLIAPLALLCAEAALLNAIIRWAR